MKKQTVTTANRARASRAAIGSIRVEGLKPSAATRGHLKSYSAGRITASQLHKLALGEVKTILARTSN